MATCRARIVVGLAVLATIAAQGCGRRSDLGTPCRLTDGGDLSDTAAVAQRDFILFGAPECEELVCLRERDSGWDGGQEGLPWGYCSAACLPDGDFCSRAAGMQCRAVLVDQASPANPYYCVRSGADAGTL